MKTQKKLILLFGTFLLFFLTGYSQNAIDKNGSYSDFYDFLDQYFNDPLYQPSNFEGRLDIKEQIIPGIYLYQIIVNGETYSVNKLVINNQ